MTELERARAHLRHTQQELRWARIDLGCRENWPEIPRYLREKETAVLAALSWVWEEQDRAQGFRHMLMAETISFRELYCQEWYLGGADGEMRYERRGVDVSA